MSPKPKRGATQLSGIVLLDKPAGLTSHDCVDKVRYALGEGRVGHCGTLDPFATGLLVICVGAACKQAEALTKHDKEYVADICFGSATDTYDCTGKVTEVVPADVWQSIEQSIDKTITTSVVNHSGATIITALNCLADSEFARETLQHFSGPLLQTPPVFSAKKVNGKPSYKLARAGKATELPPKEITVYSAELLDVITQKDSIIWQVKFVVSAGTYIRSLAHDVGQYVGVPAHLSALRRIKCGDYCVDDACTLETIKLIPQFANSI